MQGPRQNMNKVSVLRNYSTLNERIKRLIKNKKLSVAELSQLSGISVGAIQNMANSPGCNPTLEKIEAIATALEVPISFLIGEDENSNNLPKKKIPIISWNDIEKIQQKNYAIPQSLTTEYVYLFEKLSDQAFALKMQGKSMQPIFNENSILIFEPNKQKYDGCFALFYINEDKSYRFRELIIDGTSYYYKACNINFENKLHKLHKADKIIAILTNAHHSY